MKKAKRKAPRPRMLRQWWAVACCHIGDNGERCIDLEVNAHMYEKRALRLSQWLAAAAAWKAEE